jgi:DNA-binding NtrC family response regulator
MAIRLWRSLSWINRQAFLDASVHHLVLEYADEKLWVDLLEQGVYDVLLKPFAAEELRRILENARAHALWHGRAVRFA